MDGKEVCRKTGTGPGHGPKNTGRPECVPGTERHTKFLVLSAIKSEVDTPPLSSQPPLFKYTSRRSENDPHTNPGFCVHDPLFLHRSSPQGS